MQTVSPHTAGFLGKRQQGVTTCKPQSNICPKLMFIKNMETSAEMGIDFLILGVFLVSIGGGDVSGGGGLSLQSR